MPSCCINQCGARKNKKQPLLTLHRFPVNQILKKKWIEIIGQEQINPRQKILFVCSMHFEEKQFNRTLGVTRLRDGAVPSPSLMPNHIEKSQENEQQNQESKDPLDTTSPSTTPNHIQNFSEDEQQNQETTNPLETTSPSTTPLKAKTKQNQIKRILIPQSTFSAMVRQFRHQNKKIKDLTEMCSLLKSKVRSLNEVVRRRNKKIAHYSKVIEDLIKIKKNQS